MSLAELFDEPQRAHGPDAQRCSASDYPAEWAALSLGWSRVLGAARTLQSRHTADSQDPVLVQCAELRWVWARLVHQYVEGVESDV